MLSVCGGTPSTWGPASARMAIGGGSIPKGQEAAWDMGNPGCAPPLSWMPQCGALSGPEEFFSPFTQRPQFAKLHPVDMSS